MEAATARREKSLLKKKNASLLIVSARSKLLKSVNLFFANLLKSPNISTQPYLNKKKSETHSLSIACRKFKSQSFVSYGGAFGAVGFVACLQVGVRVVILRCKTFSLMTCGSHVLCAVILPHRALKINSQVFVSYGCYTHGLVRLG